MTSNDIGDIGEAIFNLVISRYGLFRPSHLGDKWPVSDFYVELKNNDNYLFFIVQVKATAKPMTKGRQLPISATREQIRKLNAYYSPTYLAGVDVIKEKVYLKAINQEVTSNIRGIGTEFEFNEENGKKLYEDVERFWKGSDLDAYKSNFKFN